MKTRALAAFAALAAIVLVFIGSLPPAVRTRIDVAPPPEKRRSGMPGAPPRGSTDEVFPPTPPDFSWIMTTMGYIFFIAIASGVIFGVFLWFSRRYHKRKLEEADLDEAALLTDLITAEDPMEAEDVALARTALADLSLSHEDRVIATWIELEDAASRRYGNRLATVTPSEWAQQRLIASGADSGAVEALLDLYYRARFRPGHVTTEADIAQASQALSRIEDSLDEAGAAHARGRR